MRSCVDSCPGARCLGQCSVQRLRCARDVLTIPTSSYTQVDAMSAVISRVFMNGNSQAVRIPQEFGLETLRVRISRNEAGDLVIQPLMADRGGALLEALRAFDDEITDDLVARLEADRRSQLPAQDREPLP